MSQTSNGGLDHYRSVGAYGAAAGEDRVQLAGNLMEAAIDRISMARGHIERNEVALKGETLQRAIGIIDGLRASLDFEQGGDIAGNLEALYDYMVRRLVEANMKNDASIVTEVLNLMNDIKTGWDGIPDDLKASPEAASGSHA
ncbi:MAG: flagellar export chaperone FliS [Gammaproteobacteria bacterium]